MNVLKKVAKKVENSKIVKNPKFLVIGLIVIVVLITLIYFIFLKYSPIMNFKYEGYAIGGKEITENLLGSSAENDSSTSKNIELTKIEEQGTIFKKLNDYFVGSKEKTEINLNYPIYINGNSSLYNLSEGSTLISKNFEEISGYPNLSISEGKIYDGNNLERADAKEYIFVKTTDNIYINLYEIKVKTTANEYTIPVNSIIAFAENSIRYYSINNNVLVFNQINDIDDNSNVEMVENGYTYKELLTRLGILQEESNNTESSNSQENIIQENTANEKVTEDNENKNNEQQNTDNNTSDQNGYIKPEVRAEDFTAEVYTAKSTLHIKDPSGRIIEAPIFEIYKDGKIYLRRTFSNSGEIQITGLIPDTEYEVIGKYIYLNENNQKVENTFYEGRFTTKGYEELGSIEIPKENGEIFSNKIQLTKVKITSDLNAEVLKGINQVEIETGEIRTVLSNSKVISLLRGEEITLETSGGLESDSTIKYTIKFYDKNGIELKVNNGEGETKTSKEKPTVRVNVKEQDIVNVTLGLKLTNRDNVELENYKYVVTRPNGEVVQEKRLSENESELLLEDLDQNQYYKISIYADYDLNDNRGKQEQVEIGNLVFATQPISTLGSLELTVENKELTSTTSTISYKIDEERTDKRLIQILNELTINIVEQPEGYGDNNQETKEGTVIYTDTLTGDEITNLQQAGTKEIKYENLKSNTAYTIEITGNVQLGNTQEEVPITYNYKEFTTLKNPAKVEIRNQFVTGNLIDFDVRIEDIDNSVLNNTVRMELREENNNLISLEELETNQDYVRKTYEKLEENKKYKLRFIADQYNEGSTDATYKANYLIKEIEIITEPGVSGEIQLTDLKREGTGKNLIDVTSKVNWRGTYFKVHNNYGKEYDPKTNELKLYCKGDSGQGQYYLYDLSDCIGQTITMSFEIKKDSKAQIYISNNKRSSGRIQNITNVITGEWQEYQYTTTVNNSGLLGFEVNSENNEEAWMYLRNVQIELGEKKTSYEPFKYNLKSTISAEVTDIRNEIENYYIQEYKNDELIEEKEYSKDISLLEDFDVEGNSEYRFDLVIKINEREYVLDSQEFITENDEEIKGINSRDEYLNIINPDGNYIVFCDLDFRNVPNDNAYIYMFTTDKYGFRGKIDFNGHKLIRDGSTTVPIFNRIEENGKVENFILEIYLDNDIEKSGYNGFFVYNYGKLKNLKVVLKECTNKPNIYIRLLGANNYGTIENFILEANEPLYGTREVTLGVTTNYGTMKNGYLYGENIKAIYGTAGSNRDSSGLCNHNNGKIANVYSLINIDTVGEIVSNNVGNLISNNNNGEAKNLYSVGYGENVYKTKGPTIYNVSNSIKVENVYYFADSVFNNTDNRKTTPLALWDTTFQNQILNSDNAFNVDELVNQGYYPQLNWPDCMPTQEYIELLEVEDKDLPDILSMEILESTKDTAKVKFSVNNPSAETITNITIENLQCTIESQEYNEGKSEVIATLNNPVICVSQYSVMSISTKGAYNQEYTRDFAENERLIDVDFYREINTTDDWKAINNSPTENYILMQDLDFRNNPYDSVISTKCTGIIDGNNHTIRNIENNRDSIVLGVQNEVRNIYFENISFLNAGSWAGIISTVNKLENVHANNVKIVITKAGQENITQGGLACVTTDEVKNCGIDNVILINNTYSYRIRIGGLIAVANSSNVSNCYATNVNIQTSNGSYYEGVGGLIGASESKSTIKNCYATGKIEIDGSTVGGIIGYINDNGEIYNSYSYVNITGNVSESGGVVGIVSSGCKLENNIALGNLYSSQLSTTPKRIIGSGTLTATNYAYSNQRLNGLIETTTEANTKLLTPEELLTQTTYTNMLNYGNAYNYSQLGENILPKLHKINEDGTYSNELLTNQEDIYLDISNEFKIYSVEIEKSAVDQIAGQIVVINTNEEEVTGLEIDGMDVTVTSIITRDRKSYINITAKPNKFYDTYKITKVKYKEEGQAKEQEVEGKIEVQFYKELYNFEDWQEIEEGTYQNYRLMSDIDFAGRTNVKTNVTMARLEGVNGNKTLKNINVEFNDENVGFIKEITTNLENINFENISISNTYNGSTTGIIAIAGKNINNINLNNITIQSENMQNTGCIGKTDSINISNINGNNINIQGSTYTGGLIGLISGTFPTISNIYLDEINVLGEDYTGGMFGYENANANTEAAKLEQIEIVNANVEGKSYVGGFAGRIFKTVRASPYILVQDSTIVGKENFTGGISGASYNVTNCLGKNINVIGYGNNIGGIAGTSNQQSAWICDSTIEGKGTNSNNVGGVFGTQEFAGGATGAINTLVKSLGSNVGGVIGYVATQASTSGVLAVDCTVEGYSAVGGAYGRIDGGTHDKEYNNSKVSASSHTAGGIVGYLDNENMTAVSNNSSIYDSYFADGKISAPRNVGGLIGDIAEKLYMPEEFYYSNYVQADIESEDSSSISLGIGGRPDQNQYLKDTYYYKYSSINGENPTANNEPFISTENYLIEEELKEEATYTLKLKWENGWNFSNLIKNKYPILYVSIIQQSGIDIPKDSEHIIESVKNSIETQNIEPQEELEQIFEYNNKTIQTYSTYSVITAIDGTQATRNAKLYVKDNNLYAIPSVVTTNEESKIVPVANNIILDNYNGKEYETVLGSDGKLYDLKEPITYPENFVNSDIESIGNNLNSDIKEVEVTYKNGDKIKFNYQTGEIISSSESDTSDGVGLFDYLVEKISEIGNSNSDISQEITNKYEESKELQTKLEETSVEEAIEKQNNPNYIENGVTAIENNETNNSLKENKYISMYNEETGQYEIYNEEELLDTSKEEVVSENEKIEANNLSEYYASEGESRNTKMGIVWIAISIIGVGIILILLKKNLKKKA